MDAAEVLAQLRADPGLREMARALLLGDELLRLPALVAELANGQLALEQAVAQLVRSHQDLRTEVDRLLVGQDELQASHGELRKAVGSLSNTVGGTAEEDAIDVLTYVARQRGYTLLSEPMARDLDGDGELDAWAPARAPDGSLVSILVEAKVRLRAREVRAWATRLLDPTFRAALAEAGIEGPYVVYAFGIRIYPEARDAARAVGIGVLSGRGEEVAPGPLAA